MKFNKVIFINNSSITEKLYNEFFMSDITSLGIDVQYVEARFLTETRYEVFPYNAIDVKNFIASDYKTLWHFLKQSNTSHTLVVSLMTYGGRCVGIYLMLTFLGLTISAFGTNSVPVPTFSYKGVLKSRKINYKLFKMGLLNKLSLWLKYVGVIKMHDILFVSGSNGLESIGRLTKKEKKSAKIININSCDYDIYLSKKNDGIHEKHIVFVDEYLPFHPDFNYQGLKQIDAKSYYVHINKYFDYLEGKYHMPVVIAAHPKAIKYKEFNYFNGREIRWGNTCEMIKDAALVVTHDSTAMDYAIAFEKPLLLLLSNEMKEKNIITYDSTIAAIEKTGASSIVYDNSDCGYDCFDVKVNHDKYRYFKYEYMTSTASENKSSKEILMDFFKN